MEGLGHQTHLPTSYQHPITTYKTWSRVTAHTGESRAITNVVTTSKLVTCLLAFLVPTFSLSCLLVVFSFDINQNGFTDSCCSSSLARWIQIQCSCWKLDFASTIDVYGPNYAKKPDLVLLSNLPEDVSSIKLMAFY